MSERVSYKANYFELVQRAFGGSSPKAVAKAIEELSATFREGRHDFPYDREVGRVAYCYHLVPAHVADVQRLVLDRPEWVDREELRVVVLGAGPGSETFGLLEAVGVLRERGVVDVRRVHVTRADRLGGWDGTFERLRDEVVRSLGERGVGLGEEWEAELPGRGVRVDLVGGEWPEALWEEVRRADLVLGPNVLTELPPRGEEGLPGGTREGLRELYRLLPGGATVVWLDRAGAPGARGRLQEAAELMREVDGGAEVDGPRLRKIRCGFALTRGVKDLYRRVRLPTTQETDAPVLNCKTLVWSARRSEP